MEAIAELNALMSRGASAPPTVAELRSIVSRSRVTLIDPLNAGLDRAGAIRGAILYSGTINETINSNKLAIALHKADPSLAIIDETHIGKLLSIDSPFGLAAIGAITLENPGLSLDDAVLFLTKTDGGFWSVASERFADANKNRNIIAITPNPSGFDPAGIYGTNEIKVLMGGTGTGAINGIKLSELRIRYNALARADDAVKALEDIAQIVSAKSLSDTWSSVSLDSSDLRNVKARFSSAFFETVGIPSGTLTNVGFSAAHPSRTPFCRAVTAPNLSNLNSGS